MPSPFPGMNPWLEQAGLWPDFHTGFLAAIKERLVALVRPRYLVLFEQHLYVHDLPTDLIRPAGRADVSLARSRAEGGGRAAVAVLEAPAEVHLLMTEQEVERVPYLEVRDRQGRELITVLELLSPSNKPGEDRRHYLAERQQVLASGAHFVEIDLLRGGPPMPLEGRPDCPYSVLVSRAEGRPRAGFWPIGLRDRLPEIPVPLRRPDADARVDLQQILHRVYDAYGYEDFLYAGSPDPPLSAEEAEWARAFVPAAS